MIRNPVFRHTSGDRSLYKRFWLSLCMTAKRRVGVVISRHLSN